MALRAQITLLLAAAIFVVGVGTMAVGLVQRHLATDRLADVALALQRSLWESLVSAKAAELNLIAIDLANKLALEANPFSRDAVSLVIDGASADNSGNLEIAGISGNLEIQVVDEEGRLIGANTPILRDSPLIGSRSLASLENSTERLMGLRQESPTRFVIAAFRPIVADGEFVGAVSAATDAQAVLDQFARETGEASFLLSPRGRLASGTDAFLWNRAQLQIPRHAAHTRFIDVGSRSYFVAPLPVDDLGGGAAGTIVALRDVTDSLRASRILERNGLLGVLAAALVIVALFYALLRNSLSPLEDSVGALDALSKGDLSRPPNTTGSGEIGRIGRAISVFRRNAQRLIEQDERISRQRRRQERVIRRELKRLADLLDDESRAEILADLSDVLPEDPSAERDNAELATLANLLSRMSRRIADQQTRLTALIAELKASIVTRERLAALEQELDIARELQATFLPRPMPPHPRFEVFGLTQSAKEVGGDFYDHFFIDEDHLAVVVADVSGKGVPAALFMAITRTLIRATALSDHPPAETVGDVNTFLAADNEQMMFVTLFLAVLSLKDGRVRCVNAGHNPPYVLAGGKPTALPRARGPALAVVESFAFSEETITLAPGEALFLYSDGVTEAFDPDGQAYGEPRLEMLLEANAQTTAKPLVELVRDDVKNFEAGVDQADDITCVALRFKG
ncbi:MAG: SpoIIE family protein phosphatase [Pseudomonadota bacterium]